MDKTQLLFNFFCYLATISLLSYCVHMYIKNDDVSEIVYKEYNDDSQSPYPSLTLCFKLKINLTKFELMNNQGYQISGSSYLNFLMGRYWDEKMLNISYDEVTESLKDYLVLAKTFKDYSLIDTTSKFLKGYRESTLPTTFGTIYKCLTFDMPNVIKQKVKFASIVFSTSLFPNGFLPTNDQLLSSLHLPNEMLASAFATQWTWTPRSQSRTKCLQMQFTIKSMTLLRRRDKLKDVCKNYPNFDENYKNAIMKKVGCRPPYWNSNINFTNCKSKKDLQLIAKYAFKGYSGSSDTENLVTKKCVELKKISFRFDENELNLNLMEQTNPELKTIAPGNENITQFFVVFEDAGIKEIKQLRAFGIESLVGNVGGYIGLFLGFSIIQLPAFCVFLSRKVYGLFGKKKISVNEQKPSDINTPVLKMEDQEKMLVFGLNKRIDLMEEKINILLHKIR